MAKLWYEFDPETASREAVAEAASSYAARLWNEDSDRRLDIDRALRRYSGRALRGLYAGGIAPDKENVRFNLTKQAVSTLVARIGSTKPRPRCLTTGADYATRQRSKQLQKFLDVLYQTERVHEVGPRVFRDAALFGTGVVKVYGDCMAGRVKVERVFPAELLIDQLDAVDGCPSIFVRVKFMTRARLTAMAHEYTRADQLKKVPSVPPSEMPSSYQITESGAVETMSSQADLVRVFELVKVAHVGEDGKLVPGRRVMAAGPVLICHEEYEAEESPFLWFHWCPPLRGFWGDSAAQEIRGPEREVNRLLQKVQRSMQLAGQPWVVAEEGSITTPKLTDEPALLVMHKAGTAEPKIQVHQPVHPDLVNQAFALKRESFAALGLTELQVSGTKPAGIESGRGLEQLGEEHSLRFRDVSQAYEQFIATDLAARMITTARELDEEMREEMGHGYEVRGRFGKEAAKVKWSDAAIAPEDFTVTCWPASILPQTPAARAEEIQRLVDTRMISAEEGQRLFDIPDLEAEVSIIKADCELLDWQICEILERGQMVAPSEEQNLTYALKRGTLALLEATRHGAPLERRDKLRDFLSECEALLQEAASQNADMSAQGAAMPMPTSPAAAMQGGMLPSGAGQVLGPVAQ